MICIIILWYTILLYLYVLNKRICIFRNDIHIHIVSYNDRANIVLILMFVVHKRLVFPLLLKLSSGWKPLLIYLFKWLSFFELHIWIASSHRPHSVYITLVFPLVSQLIQLSAVKNSHVYIPASSRQIQHTHTLMIGEAWKGYIIYGGVRE